MNQYCVVVANGTKARFFTLEDVEFPEIQSGPNLIKKKDLTNQELELHKEGLWTESKSGGNRAHGGQSHGYDDHRAQHGDEAEKRFAHTIADECKRFSLSNNTRKVVLVSQQRMLSHLRSALNNGMQGVHTRELAKDLSKMTAQDIQLHLAREKLIPERRAPGFNS